MRAGIDTLRFQIDCFARAAWAIEIKRRSALRLSALARRILRLQKRTTKVNAPQRAAVPPAEAKTSLPSSDLG
jgi:hypothetical protein